jgi:hypothetical protein
MWPSPGFLCPNECDFRAEFHGSDACPVIDPCFLPPLVCPSFAASCSLFRASVQNRASVCRRSQQFGLGSLVVFPTATGRGQTGRLRASGRLLVWNPLGCNQRTAGSSNHCGQHLVLASTGSLGRPMCARDTTPSWWIAPRSNERGATQRVELTPSAKRNASI